MITLRLPVWVLLVAGLALVGVIAGWALAYGRWQERVRDLDAQIAVTDDSLAVERSRRAAAEATDRARQDTLAALRSEREGLDRDLTATRHAVHAAESSYDSLRARVDVPTLPAPVRKLVAGAEALAGAAQAEARACSVVLLNCERQRGILERQVVSRDTTIARQDRLTARLTAERDSARALLRPPPPFHVGLEIGVLGPHCNRAGCDYVGVGITVARFRLPL